MPNCDSGTLQKQILHSKTITLDDGLTMTWNLRVLILFPNVTKLLKWKKTNKVSEKQCP